MNIEYRRALVSDIEQAQLIEQYAPDPWTKEDIIDTLSCEAARSYVAILDGAIAAFCSLHIVASEANLNTITVLPAFRRSGVASGLLSHVITEIGVTDIYLEVRAANIAAISLYEALGFTRQGLRKGFYTKPTDNAIVMSLHNI